MMKVLIVDDEKIMRIGLKMMIPWEKNGFEWRGGAKDGLVALKMIKSSKPDIVITDLRMPNMDGLELIAILRIDPAFRGKVIVLSNYDEFDLVREALKLGAIDYLLKVTLKPDDLLKTLNNAVSQILVDRDQDAEERIKSAELRESHMLAKNQLFKDLIFEEDFSDDEIDKQAQKHGLFLDDKPFFIMTINIEHYETNKWKRRKLLAFSMRNIILELVEDVRDLEFIQINYREYMLVLPVQGIYETEHGKKKLARRIKEMLALYLDLKVHLVISAYFTKIRDVKEAFLTCKQEAEERLNIGIGKSERLLVRKHRKEIRTVIEYFEKNMDSRISLKEVANQVNMNESYLSRLFKHETGSTIIQYLNGMRMKRAQQLLKDPDLNVKDVSELVGIPDQFYFNRLFNKKFNQSPTEYKKNSAQNESQNNPYSSKNN